MTLETEQSLLQAARSGDMKAFEQLYRQTMPIILNGARRLAGSQEAEDLVQETYVRALSSIAKFRGECRLATWLYKLLCSSIAESKRKAVSHPESPLSSDVYEANVRDPRLNLDLQRGLQFIPSADREIICRRLQGYSNSDIARHLGLSTTNSTIRVRICRAHRAMQFALLSKTPSGNANPTERTTKSY